MRIKQLNANVRKQLAHFSLQKKYHKQALLFTINPAHPSLNTEKLEPKTVGLYSFRIDRRYRAIFRIRVGQAEILHITKHYQQ